MMCSVLSIYYRNQNDSDDFHNSTIDLNKQQLQDYVNSKRNISTQKKTTSDMNKFTTWLTTQDQRHPLELISPTELDILIGHFIKSLKKPDGSNYEPGTRTSFHRSIERHLSDHNYPYNILTDDLFATSRAVLQAKRKELKQEGLGKKPRKTEPLTADEENRLWVAGQLGASDPTALLNTVWFFNTKLFGLRGSGENRKLQWGDITIKDDEDGNEYLEYNERQTKTRDGNTPHIRPFKAKNIPKSQQP